MTTYFLWSYMNKLTKMQLDVHSVHFSQISLWKYNNGDVYETLGILSYGKKAYQISFTPELK